MGISGDNVSFSGEKLEEDFELVNLTRSRRGSKRGQHPQQRFRSDCTCGIQHSGDTKIVGGQSSTENAWPWVVPLVYTGDKEPWQFCGASIINSQYLLTACHCAIEMRKKITKYEVYIGSNSISDYNVIKVSISQVKLHPHFNSKTLENDIALIKLSKPITFSEKVAPICLRQEQSTYIGQEGVVTGWGSVRKGGRGVDKLREAKVQVLNNAACARNYSTHKIRISSRMMCASLPPSDSCQGDSGGPLFIWNSRSKAYCQIGLVSFGTTCGSEAYPGVYTRVSYYTRWIQENTRDASYCQRSF